MRAAARELKFEDAARLRDELKRVEALILHAGESAGRARDDDMPPA
jgi:excinuclease UvrABC nuclease subunit